MDQTPDVPLFVDDSRVVPGEFPFIRCNYLSIERDEPESGWQLVLGNVALPFLLLHLGGVITQPIGAAQFTASTLIDRLFTSVEDDERFSLDVGDIWIPEELFPRTPQAGDVYRIGRRLFDFALRYRYGHADAESLLVQSKELHAQFRFSEQETFAFQQWRETQRNDAKAKFPKNKELQLRRRDVQP